MKVVGSIAKRGCLKILISNSTDECSSKPKFRKTPKKSKQIILLKLEYFS